MVTFYNGIAECPIIVDSVLVFFFVLDSRGVCFLTEKDLFVLLESSRNLSGSVKTWQKSKTLNYAANFKCKT